METFLSDPYAIAAYIKQAVKKTPVKLWVQGNFKDVNLDGLMAFGSSDFKFIVGEAQVVEAWLDVNKANITAQFMEVDRRNSAIPLLDIRHLEARIEPGVTIRDFVTIGKQVVIMMGAVINIGAVIGDGTMIDMNAVVGARGTIGKNCHIGAGAVVAGVLEPPSKQPVIIEDDVLVGANAVILEGVRIGKGSVVAAGAVVLEDVPPGVVVAGSPAKIVKVKDAKTEAKTEILQDLRK